MEVTFIICNHNYGEYIKESVKSALNQDYPCNICVIDDASTDYSVDTVRQLIKFNSKTEKENYTIYEGDIKNNKRFSLIVKRKNSGPSESRNIGIEETIQYTDIYSILDADDAVSSSKVSSLLPYFQDNNVGVVYADYLIKNVETGMLSREFKTAYCKSKLLRECIVHSGSLIRARELKKVQDENGFYDKTLRVCEDYDLWLRLSNNCIIMHHAEPLTIVKVTPKNSTNSVDNSVWQENMMRVRQKCAT